MSETRELKFKTKSRALFGSIYARENGELSCALFTARREMIVFVSGALREERTVYVSNVTADDPTPDLWIYGTAIQLRDAAEGDRVRAFLAAEQERRATVPPASAFATEPSADERSV